MTLLSLAFDARISHLQPWAFHLQSIAWHVLNSLLVLRLCKKLLPGNGAALFGGLFFAVHPVLTEAIDNASSRSDPLATAFVLLAILLALREDRRSIALACAALACGLLSKESALIAPLLFAAIAVHQPLNSRRQLWKPALFLGFTSLIYILLRIPTLDRANPGWARPGGSLLATLWGMPQLFLYDIKLAFFPFSLCADDTGRFNFDPRADLLFKLACATVLFAILALACLPWPGKRLPAAKVGLLWFFIALAPVSNLIPLPIVAAERYLYLPMAGISLLVAALLSTLYTGEKLIENNYSYRENNQHINERAPRRSGGPWREPIILFVSVGLLVFALLSNLRHRVWRDDRALWKNTVQVNPHSFRAQNWYGLLLIAEGKLDEGVGHLQKAIAVHPGGDGEREKESRAFLEYSLGEALVLQGKREAGRAALRRAVALYPGYSDARASLVKLEMTPAR